MRENKPISRKENIVVQEVDGEVLIYDLKKNKAFCLNKTSSLVWQACDGKRTIADINNWLGKQLNSQTDEDVVWLALDQLSKENLIEDQIKLENHVNGLPRREAIKRIGTASLIALPIIASLTAPTAAQTATPVCGATNRPAGCPCQSNNECASGNCGTPQQGPNKTCQ
jgi:hypothetical protein